MNTIVLSPMTEAEAGEWKRRIGDTSNTLRMLIFDGYERAAWIALGYSNWSDCLRALAEEYGFTERRLWQLHQANQIEQVVTEKISVGQIPDAHLRPLASVPDDKKREVYQTAVETAPNGKVTAAHVQAVKEAYWSPEPTNNGSNEAEPADRLIFKPVTFTGDADELEDEPEYDDDDDQSGGWDGYGIHEKRAFIEGAEYAEQNRPLRLAAANHVISDDPDYDGDEWYTPIEYIDAARRVMGSINVDPATCIDAQNIVKADTYYTKEDNSLRREVSWVGNIWLNPPYSARLIVQFVDKLLDEYERGNVTQAVIITNNSSDTTWFHKLIYRFPACFTRGRVKFWRPNADDFGARQGQTLFYLGDNADKFCREFSNLGVVVKRI